MVIYVITTKGCRKGEPFCDLVSSTHDFRAAVVKAIRFNMVNSKDTLASMTNEELRLEYNESVKGDHGSDEEWETYSVSKHDMDDDQDAEDRVAEDEELYVAPSDEEDEGDEAADDPDYEDESDTITENGSDFDDE